MKDTAVVLVGPKGLAKAAACVVAATLGCAALFATLPRMLARPPAPAAPMGDLRDAVAAEADASALAALRLAERQLARRPGPDAPAGPPWSLLFSPILAASLAVALGLQLWSARRRATPTHDRARRLDDDAPPVLPAGYRMIRKLGEGGMGIVFEAEDSKLGRRVAVKMMRDAIRDDPRERERFVQEARLVAALHHPTIVDIHTIIEDEENLSLVFEYVAGKTVEQLLTERRCLPLEETKRIMRGVCDALDFAHRRGVVHRDLKPSNIMVSDEDEIKVMDFGVARRAKESLSRLTTETVAGTPLYMAPEAEDGVVRKESDIYALGACLYEMTTGEGVFSSPTTRAAKMLRRYIPPSRQRAGLPSSLDMLVDWALQPEPEKRIPTAAAFALHLEELA